MWYLDLSKLFKKQTGAYKLFNENIDIKKDPMFYYNNNKDTFQTLWDLYGKWVFNQTNATWSMDKTSSSDLFMPI
jgi:hypothetical protein